VSIIQTIIKSAKHLYAPYIKKTINLFFVIIKKTSFSNVKIAACDSIADLITVAKADSQEFAVNLTKHFITNLMQLIEKEISSEVICAELDAVRAAIEELDFCFFTQEEVQQLSGKLLELLEISNKASTEEVLDAEAD
jgi:hypothetical protein